MKRSILSLFLTALFAGQLFGQATDSTLVDPDSARAIDISNLAEETAEISIRLRPETWRNPKNKPLES